MKHRLASIAVLLAASAAPALADPKADAKARIEKATTLHAEGKYKEALDELTIAYALDPRPELLYAIGQVHVQLGDCTSAISFYERFLASKPAAGPAAAAREAIKTCKTAPPEPAKTEPVVEPTPEPTPEPAPPEPEPTPPPPVAEQPTGGPGPWYTDKLGDALVGGGIVLGVVSVVFYQGARGKLDDAEAAPTYDEHDSLVSDAKSQRNLAVGFAVGSVALIGAGVARFVLRDSGEAKRVAVTPISGGGAITWTRSF